MAKLDSRDFLDLIVDLAGRDADETWWEEPVETVRDHGLGEEILDLELFLLRLQ